jgi:DNA-binding MarR family transcriptional regulator
MRRFPSELQTDELRRLWHALAGKRRAVKDDARFRAIHGLSPMETGVLDLAAETPEVVLGEIGVALGLPKSTLTSIVDRLEAQGFLRRTISRRDRRSYGLELTRKGRTAYEAHRRFETEIWRRTLAGLDSDAEGEQFLATLRKMVAVLGSEERHG